MDEVNDTARAHSPLYQTSSVEKEEDDSSCRDCSTDDNITKDLDQNKVRNNNDRVIVTRNAAEKIEKQSTKDDKGESVNPWHAADNIARGGGPLYSSQEMSDDDHNEEQSRSKTMNYKKKESSFLWKIHEILEEMSKEQKEHIVSWSPRGTSFKVHNPEAFVQEVMPRYSTATQFRSFEKMLNLYDFKKLKGGPQRGGYQHPLFRRDNRELCKKIKMRPKPKRKKKANRICVGGRKSHVEDDFFSGFDEDDMSEKKGSMLGKLEDEEDRHLSSIDDISMGYFQQMTTGVHTNLHNYNESLGQAQTQADEVHASNLYQSLLNMRTSHPHLSSLIGVTTTTGSSGGMMEDSDTGTSSSATTTNQQQFAIFRDHPIIPAIPSSTTRSATSTVVPFLNLDSRHDHSTTPAAALAGSFMQSPTTMMGSIDFGVAGGMMPSFPTGGRPLMSGASATGQAPSTTNSILPTRSRTVTSGSTPTLLLPASQINPTSLLDPPPFYDSSLHNLGGRRGGTSSAGTTNIFLDAATQEQQARRRSWSHSSAMEIATSSTRMMSPLSSSSFDHPTMMMAKDHRHQEEQNEGGYDDHDDHHHFSMDVERIFFEEPLSDDLEPTHLPPPS